MTIRVKPRFRHARQFSRTTFAQRRRNPGASHGNVARMSWTARLSQNFIGLDKFAMFVAAHAARYRSPGQRPPSFNVADVKVQNS